VQELLDSWETCFPMECVPDDPGCVESSTEEFILELRVGHVSPDHRAVHHSRSNYHSINGNFVLYGHLALLPDQ
jgi:hypothetical protein